MYRGGVCRAWRMFAWVILGFVVLSLVLFGAGGPAAFAAPAPSAHALVRPLPRVALDRTVPLAAVEASPGSFPFQTTTSSDGLIIVHWYKQASDFGQQVITEAQSALSATISNTLGFKLLRAVNIYVYASRADFLAGAPVDNADETGALTVSGTSTIYIEYGNDNPGGLFADLPHELTHVVFHQNEDSASIQDFFTFFPRWLDEGLAASDEGGGDYASPLATAVQKHALIDILTVFNNDYPSDPDVDFLAYAEARSFILYLEQTAGADAFHQFLRDVRDGNINLAAERRFGAGLTTLEARWENSLGALPAGVNVGYLPALASATPYAPGALPATASTLAPFPVSPTGAIPMGWLLALLGLFAVGLVMLTYEWSRRRARQPGRIITLQQSTLPPSPFLEFPTANSSAPEAGAEAPSPWAQDTSSNILTLPRSRRSREMPWYEEMLLLLPIPAAAAAALTAINISALHEWRIGYLAAFCVAVPCFIFALALTVLHRADGLPLSRALALVMTALLAVVTFSQIASSARLQASAYEIHGAYALALRYDAGAGVSSADLATIHRRWASAALAVRDYQTATEHFQAALALDDAGAKSADQAMLLKAVEAWGAGLQGSGAFDAAVKVYNDEAQQSECATACKAQMHADAATATLAWGDALYLQGNLSSAHDKYASVIHDYQDTAAAKPAQQAYGETGGRIALASARAAGDRGDYTGMNTQLRALEKDYPNTVAVQDARSMPEPVNGTIQDASGASVSGDRLFFLGFPSAAAARSFDFSVDTSVLKVATTIRSGGNFSVRLPPGLWYVACWNDPSQSAASNFNEPNAYGNEAFTIARYTPATIGVIVGF